MRIREVVGILGEGNYERGSRGSEREIMGGEVG